MGALSPWHLLIVVLLFVLLFGGKGKITSIMGDFASGIKAFRKGMSDDANKVEQQSGLVDVTPKKEAEKASNG